MKKKIFELMGIAVMIAVVLVACRAEGEIENFYSFSREEKTRKAKRRIRRLF